MSPATPGRRRGAANGRPCHPASAKRLRAPEDGEETPKKHGKMRWFLLCQGGFGGVFFFGKTTENPIDIQPKTKKTNRLTSKPNPTKQENNPTDLNNHIQPKSQSNPTFHPNHVQNVHPQSPSLVPSPKPISPVL